MQRYLNQLSRRRVSNNYCTSRIEVAMLLVESFYYVYDILRPRISHERLEQKLNHLDYKTVKDTRYKTFILPASRISIIHYSHELAAAQHHRSQRSPRIMPCRQNYFEYKTNDRRIWKWKLFMPVAVGAPIKFCAGDGRWGRNTMRLAGCLVM